ncbi:MAG: VPS10 domain-containing protein [Bacteroidota bacterium]
MRRSLFLLSLLCIVGVAALRGQGFHTVHSSDGVTVWAAGNSGLLWRSTDGGAVWESYSLTAQTLRSVFALGSHVWVVGDAGIFLHSTDAGSNWSSATINGGTGLRAAWFANADTGWVAGDNGSLLVTNNGGGSWAAQTSGTADRLNTLWFGNAQFGFAGGANGTLRKTTDGGASWSNSADVLWTEDIYALSGKFGTGAVYAVGEDGFGSKSTASGTSWTPLKLRTDARSDAMDVFVFDTDTAMFVGGGGYIRSTKDGGATSQWPVHSMHGRLTSIFFYNSLKGWTCSDKNNAIMRSTDGGTTWSLPTGTTASSSWSLKQSAGNTRGDTFVMDPWNKDRLFAVFGSRVYVSTNRGDNWTIKDTIPGDGLTHSFYVSPKDSNLWVAANDGSPEGIKRTTNAGATWTTTIAKAFTSYGMPLEMNPDKPDTLLFAADGSGGSGANGRVYRSTNFGLTWDTLAITSFRSPCDVIIVPDSNNIVYVGDGVTGSGLGRFWKSTTDGTTWTLIDSVSGSEIPTMSIGRLRNNEAFFTAWGSGGFKKSTNHGSSWTQVATTGSTWGTDVSKDDPNVLIYGVYSGGLAYLSTNAGTSFTTSSLGTTNYSYLCYDRGTILAQQSGGVYKLAFSYVVPISNAQVVSVLSPNGGETWAYNSVQNITWVASNVANVRLDYKTSAAGPWQTIIASTPAAAGSYAWTVPNDPTIEARIRISDASDVSPIDSSNGTFSITVSAISSAPTSLAFGNVLLGSSGWDTVRISNPGIGTLVITSVTTGNADMVPGRTSFTIAPGESDTLSVRFSPSSSGVANDVMSIANNSATPVFNIPLSGTGEATIPALVLPLNGVQYLSVSPELEWDVVPSALSYQLHVATDSAFAGVVVNDSGVVGTSTTVGPLAGNVVHYWRVRAISGGGPGQWSSQWKFSTTASVTNQYPVLSGWNMLSLPLKVGDPRKSTLYPTSSSLAYGYIDAVGYSVMDSLHIGSGYWLKFDADQDVSISGDLIGSDTIAIGAGWNILGAISAPVSVSSIVEVPSGVVQSAYFGYNTGYVAADSLYPGKSYWVKTNAAGQLIFAPIALPAVVGKGKKSR